MPNCFSKQVASNLTKVKTSKSFKFHTICALIPAITNINDKDNGSEQKHNIFCNGYLSTIVQANKQTIYITTVTLQCVDGGRQRQKLDNVGSWDVLRPWNVLGLTSPQSHLDCCLRCWIAWNVFCINMFFISSTWISSSVILTDKTRTCRSIFNIEFRFR